MAGGRGKPKKRGQTRSESKGSKNPPRQALDEATQLQQRAERKRGLDALPAYEAACTSYRQLLSSNGALPLNNDQKSGAYYGLAACLANAADCLWTGSQSESESDLNEAQKMAQSMFQEAINAYQQVKGDDGNIQNDALVDCGNAMASLAEISEPEISLKLLEDASHAYRRSLEANEDAATCSNLGDVLVSAGEHLVDGNNLDIARQVYTNAMTQYEKACTLSNSDQGDDLPGLLHNWGVGLQSAGTKLKDIELLREAVRRLRSAKELGHSDVTIIVALGDTLLSLAEETRDTNERFEALKAAQSEGFHAALEIDRRQPDALIGSAETEMLLGRDLKGGQAVLHFKESLRLYALALERPELLGSWKDRNEVRYNQACAASLAGNTKAAQNLVGELLRSGAGTWHEISNDNDFSMLHGSDFWKNLQAR